MQRPHSRREHSGMKNLKTNVAVGEESVGVCDKAGEISTCQVMQGLVGYIKEFSLCLF